MVATAQESEVLVVPNTIDVRWPPSVVDAPLNVALIHQVVTAQQAAKRQGTHQTKARGDVRGGGRKPHRQKGTGRARQGSIRAPQYRGGGAVHGPKPRDYAQRTPKKMIRGSLRSVLGEKVRAGQVVVVDRLVVGDKPSTRSALAALVSLSQAKRHLVVLERGDALTWLSLRNVKSPLVHLIAVDQLNSYDLVVADFVTLTFRAFETLKTTFETADDVSVTNSHSPGERSPAGNATMVGIPHATDSKAGTAALDLQIVRENLSAMTDYVITSRESDDSSAIAIGMAGIDAVAVERHEGFVLVSWPTLLSCDAAIDFLREVISSDSDPADVSVYAGLEDGGEEYEFEDGAPVDWGLLSGRSNNLEYVRAEIPGVALIWRRADGPDERHARFALLEPSLGKSTVSGLMLAAGDSEPAAVVEGALGADDWSLLPLNETA